MSETPQKAKVITFKSRDLLIKEGARDRYLYVIRTGSVRVYKTYLGKKLTLAILGKGEVFGELSFFDGKPRIANVEAVDDGEMLAIDGEQVQGDLDTLPSWMPGVFKTIISRLRETDNKLTLLKNKFDMGSGAKDNDLIIREILIETLRIAKIFKLFINNISRESIDNFDKAVEELGILCGPTFLKVEKLLLAFEKDGYIKATGSGANKSLDVNNDDMNLLIDYVSKKLANEEIWILSRSALRFLSEVLNHIEKENKNFSAETLLTELINAPDLEKFINSDDFFREAKAFGLKDQNNNIMIKVAEIKNHLKFQTLMANYNIRVD